MLQIELDPCFDDLQYFDMAIEPSPDGRFVAYSCDKRPGRGGFDVELPGRRVLS